LPSNSTRAVGRAAKRRAHMRGRKPSEALGRLVRRAACTHRAARMRDRRVGIIPTLLAGRRPPPGTRGRRAPRSYNSGSRARLSDCGGGGGGRKPVSRRPCRVATARSTYHTAVVPAILVDEGGARIAGPATPERSCWPARARARSRGRAYTY